MREENEHLGLELHISVGVFLRGMWRLGMGYRGKRGYIRVEATEILASNVRI